MSPSLIRQEVCIVWNHLAVFNFRLLSRFYRILVLWTWRYGKCPGVGSYVMFRCLVYMLLDIITLEAIPFQGWLMSRMASGQKMSITENNVVHSNCENDVNPVSYY